MSESQQDARDSHTARAIDSSDDFTKAYSSIYTQLLAVGEAWRTLARENVIYGNKVPEIRVKCSSDGSIDLKFGIVVRNIDLDPVEE